jgi:predicted dehydrogenase
MIHFGLIGCGHWGKNYIRVLQELKSSRLVACCDANIEHLKSIQKNFQEIQWYEDYQELLKDNTIETIVVATPPTSHFDIVKNCLEAGKHVIAEKPLTLTLEECKVLFELADQKNLKLLVGYTFLFNSAIKKIKQYLQDGSMGQVYYIHATRTHLGLVRPDVNVVWDLAPHDVSIFLYLLEETPISVSATGACFLKEGRQDIAFITLKFPSGIIANIHVSWVNSNKVRELQVIGKNARIIFDDLNNLEKVKIFKKRMEVKSVEKKEGSFQEKPVDTFADFQYILREGDIVSPYIELFEPLKSQTDQFIQAIMNDENIKEHRDLNMNITKVMCGIQESIQKNGAPVELN